MDPLHRSPRSPALFRAGRFSPSPGVELHFELRRSAAPAAEFAGRMLILMGAMGTCKHLDEIADDLAQQGFEVLTSDPRGIGRSTISPPADRLAAQSSDMLADDALALAEHVWCRGGPVRAEESSAARQQQQRQEPPPAVGFNVLGISMGGMVAQRLAVKLCSRGGSDGASAAAGRAGEGRAGLGSSDLLRQQLRSQPRLRLDSLTLAVTASSYLFGVGRFIPLSHGARRRILQLSFPELCPTASQQQQGSRQQTDAIAAKGGEQLIEDAILPAGGDAVEAACMGVSSGATAAAEAAVAAAGVEAGETIDAAEAAFALAAAAAAEPTGSLLLRGRGGARGEEAGDAVRHMRSPSPPPRGGGAAAAAAAGASQAAAPTALFLLLQSALILRPARAAAWLLSPLTRLPSLITRGLSVRAASSRHFLCLRRPRDAHAVVDRVLRQCCAPGYLAAPHPHPEAGGLSNGELWRRRWAAELSDWFAFHDLDACAAQARNFASD